MVAGCAAAAPGRQDTWINADIERLFGALHRMGHAHSVECRRDGMLVGGLYGVSLGGVFFGESMFSTARDASKVALVHLAARMRLGGYTLLDTQFVTSHLAQFGADEIPRERYKAQLAAAVAVPARWLPAPSAEALEGEIKAMYAQSAERARAAGPSGHPVSGSAAPGHGAAGQDAPGRQSLAQDGPGQGTPEA